MNNRYLPLIACTLAMLVAMLVPRPAQAIDRNFAASAQIDYMLAPTVKGADAMAHNAGFDGFTTELSVKMAVDLTDHLSANVKFCYGCHGLEADMAYMDYRVVDELNFRLGKFSPSFGAFNLRHDPANHRLSDKPLPYDMGRALGFRAFNLGVLPSPFPDNGAEVNGTHWFGDDNQLDYAAYVVSGFKGDATAQDIDFTQNRELYYVDNNGRPTYGGRLALTHKFSSSADSTIGASGMRGTYDPNNTLFYTIVGADASLRVKRTNVRMEYLARRTDISVADPTQFVYALPNKNSDFMVKHGAYIELEQPLNGVVDLIVRADGLMRVGDVVKGSPIDRISSVGRATLGTAFLVQRDLRIKASTEYYHFSDLGPTGQHNDVSFHLGAVGTF